MEISIKIKNAFTGQIEVDTTRLIDVSRIDMDHRLYSMAWPNSFVNFVWGDPGEKSFIAGQPYNMKLDETAHSEGRMSFEEYAGKWYSRSGR